MFFRYMTLVLLFVICCPVSQVFACYAVIVGREASEDGSVLVGHNEQNGGRRILNFRRIPRRQFGEGAAVNLRRGGKLAQVDETCALFWSENRLRLPRDSIWHAGSSPTRTHWRHAS